MVGWLERGVQESAPLRGLCGSLWVAYYLERGRTPEALYAFARSFGGVPGDDPTRQMVAHLLQSAADQLPSVYARLVVRVRAGAMPALRALGGEALEGGDVALGFVLGQQDDGPVPARELLSTGPTLRRCPLVCLPERVHSRAALEEAAGADALPVWPEETQGTAVPEAGQGKSAINALPRRDLAPVLFQKPSLDVAMADPVV